MTGVLFVVCIPTEPEEISQRNYINLLKFDEIVADSEVVQSEKTPTNLKSEIFQKVQISNKKSKEILIPKNKSKDAHSIAINIEDGGRKFKNSYESVDSISISDDFHIGLSSPINGNIYCSSGTIKKSRSFNSINLSESEQSKNSKLSVEPKNFIRKSWDGYIKEIVSSAKQLSVNKKKLPIEKSNQTLPINNDASMELVVKEILKKMKIKNANWKKSDIDGKSYQIMFTVETGYCHETVLTLLNEWGIGERDGSSVSIVPCTGFYKPPLKKSVDNKNIGVEEASADDTYDKHQGIWDRFMKSMRARLNVAQIVEEVRQDASITFDFISLLVIASLLAGFGLIEDSTIFLASSMLISPLMGPVIAVIFGTVIKDHTLTKFGIINELIGILIATTVGFLFGLIICTIDSSYSNGEGLTNEMLSRCEIHSLLVGVFTAIPSGAAVAIAILGENIGSLVGVAISASLLPPAVNAGLLWALSLLYITHQKDETSYNIVIKTAYYSDHQATELAILGSISMTLTVINIVLIYVTGILFLKIKEVAPIVSRNQRQFWNYDVKVARDYNRTCQPSERGYLRKRLVDEMADFHESETDRLGFGTSDLLKHVVRPSYQHTWSPMTLRHRLYSNDPKLSIQELENLYLNMSKPAEVREESGLINRRIKRLGSTATNKILGKSLSPPKYKSLLSDHIYSKFRPPSSYFNNYGSTTPTSSRTDEPQNDATATGHGFKSKNLDKITEMPSASIVNEGASTSKKSKLNINTSSSVAATEVIKRAKKFTVTPATLNDPLLKK